MKKGFTMIELIFVIVILGILASVAIPRLAATREDAEISAAVANLRTLVSDASAYLVAKDKFGQAKWNEITNVPLEKNSAGAAVDSTVTASTKVYLKVGDINNCIGVQLTDRTAVGNTNKPAHILITKEGTPTGACKQVQDADPLKPYFTSTVAGVTVSNGGAMAIGSSTDIYTSTATTTAAAPAKTKKN